MALETATRWVLRVCGACTPTLSTPKEIGFLGLVRQCDAVDIDGGTMAIGIVLLVVVIVVLLVSL